MSAGRITEGMLGRRLLSDLRASTARMATAQRQIASGKRIDKPSDDPLATHNALRLRSELAGIAQDQRTISDTQGWLDTTDSALATITDVVHRARELALQGANGAIGQTERNKLADEIDQLIETAKSAANTSYGGRYVFAGAGHRRRRPTPPGAVDTYDGDSLPDRPPDRPRRLGPDQHARRRHPRQRHRRHQAADDAPHARGRPAQRQRRGVRGPALEQPAVQPRGRHLGARHRRRPDDAARGRAKARLAQVEESTTALLSENEDTDIAKAMIDLTTQQSVYQAALQSGQALIQPSLLDFLR